MVHSCEKWTDKKVVGGEKISQPNASDWWWMLCEKLKGYPLQMAYHAGHRRWGIENKAFNELTQYYHLEHCYHHEPVAMLAQMLILMLGFVLFSAYAVLHCQPVRLGQITMKALAHDLDLALEEDLPLGSVVRQRIAASGGQCFRDAALCQSADQKEELGSPGELSSCNNASAEKIRHQFLGLLKIQPRRNQGETPGHLPKLLALGLCACAGQIPCGSFPPHVDELRQPVGLCCLAFHCVSRQNSSQ